MASLGQITVEVLVRSGDHLYREDFAEIEYDEDSIWRAKTADGKTVFIHPGMHLMVVTGEESL